jgi:acetyl-CoA C-acetyltransferase
MWAQVARAAVRDSARPALTEAIQGVNVVHCSSWAYDDPPHRLAERLGVRAGPRRTSILAGTAHQRMVDAAAERILSGETEVELVVGGEALWTARQHRRAGETPPWRFGNPPVGPPIDLDAWFLPTELAHGVVPAWLTFALLDDARRHWLGTGPADHRERIGRMLAGMSQVAAHSPHAWFLAARRAAELTTPTEDNRMVATPYTKWMVATPDVDMAAATILTSSAAADRLGIPHERRVYLRSWGFGRDAVHLASRAELHASPAMRAVFADTLRRAGLGIDDIGVLDLYSCFASSVDFARDALGLTDDDARSVTATGGLPFHGGPSANYTGHSVVAVVERVRQGAGAGLVSGVGMHMTKHVAAVYAAEPGVVVPPDPELESRLEAQVHRPVATAVDGPATVAAHTVVHDRDGAPDHAIAVCTTSSGERCYARTDDPDALGDMLADPWTGRVVGVRPTGTTNGLTAPTAVLVPR